MGIQIGGVEEPWAPGTNPRSDAKSNILDAADAFANAQGFGPNWKGPSVAVSPPEERAAAPQGPYRGPLGVIGGPIVDAARAVGGAVANAGIPGNPISGMFSSAPPVYDNSVARGAGTLQGSAASPAATAPAVGRYPSEGSNAIRGYQGTPAAATPTGIAAGSTMPAPMVGGGPIAGSAGQTDQMVAIRNELAQRRAAEDMGQQQKIQAMQANANWASDWTAQRDAASNARAANFDAKNAATDLAGNIGGSRGSLEPAAREMALIANAANNRLATADANLQKSQAGLAGTPRNYIDEFGKLQTADKERMNAQSLQTTAGARVTEANARATEAGAKAELERAQAIGITLNNDQHKKILDLSSKMFTGTPEEAAKAERSIRTLLGKNADRYEIKPLGGGSVVNASGFPEVQPQTLAIVDKETGQAVEFKAGGGAAKGPPASADRISELKKNDTPQMRAYFDQAYGAGAAARALGK